MLSRLLGAGEIGSFVLAASLTVVAGQLVDVGPQWALISRPMLTPALLWAHAYLQIGSAVVVLVVAVVSRALVARVSSEEVATLVIVVAITRLLAALGSTSRALLEKEFRFVGLAAVSILAATCALGLGIALALGGYGVWALALGAGPPSMVAAAIQAVGYLALRPLPIRALALRCGEVAWYLRYGRPLWLGTQTVSVATQLDSLVVGLFLGPVSLGLYDRAYRIIQTLVALVNQTFGRVALPMYAQVQRLGSGEVRDAQELWGRLLLRMALPLAAWLGVAAPEIVAVLLGPGWEASMPLLVLLTPYLVLRVLDENLLAYLMGTGRTWSRTFGWVLVAGTSIVILPLLVALLGITGAPVGVGVAMAVGLLWQQWRVSSGHLRALVTDAVPPLLAAGLAISLGLITGALATSLPPLPLLAAKTVALLAAYLLGLVVFDSHRSRQLVRDLGSFGEVPS